MLRVAEKGMVLEKVEQVKPELKDFLDTYLAEHNQLTETYAWLKNKIGAREQVQWERNLQALSTICFALDAGFDPYTPPAKWHSGMLSEYRGAIPTPVREKIDVALPIFGPERVLIYDPNPERFVKPRVIDPVATGQVVLENKQYHFLIGAWDLAKDRRYIEGQGVRQQNPEFERLTNAIRTAPIDSDLRWLPGITTDSTTTGSAPWMQTNLPSTYMTFSKAFRR